MALFKKSMLTLKFLHRGNLKRKEAKAKEKAARKKKIKNQFETINLDNTSVFWIDDSLFVLSCIPINIWCFI